MNQMRDESLETDESDERFVGISEMIFVGISESYLWELV